MTLGLPQHFSKMPRIQSYAYVGEDGALRLVQVRGDVHHKVQATLRLGRPVLGSCRLSPTSIVDGDCTHGKGSLKHTHGEGLGKRPTS